MKELLVMKRQVSQSLHMYRQDNSKTSPPCFFNLEFYEVNNCIATCVKTCCNEEEVCFIPDGFLIVPTTRRSCQRWNLSLEDQCVPAKLLRLSGDVLPLPPLGPMMPPPPLQQSAEANATLFQWQIQQEERRVGGVPLELLHTADGDGDT